MRRADFRAGEHGDGQLGNHAHVDRDAVALHDAQRFQRVGEAIHFALEHAERQHARIARLAFPDDGGLVAPRGMRVPVHAVVGDVELSAHEPFGPRRVPFQHLLPRREPVQILGLLRPEAFGIFRGAIVDGGIVPVGALPEFFRRRKRAAFVEQGGKILVAGQ